MGAAILLKKKSCFLCFVSHLYTYYTPRVISVVYLLNATAYFDLNRASPSFATVGDVDLPVNFFPLSSPAKPELNFYNFRLALIMPKVGIV